MRWDEQQRLTNLARAVARHPAVRLTLEAFGDTPGTDALNVGIAKHRLKTAQAIMNRAGLSDERLTLLTSDVTVDPRFARSIRLTSAPPLSEVEKP